MPAAIVPPVLLTASNDEWYSADSDFRIAERKPARGHVAPRAAETDGWPPDHPIAFATSDEILYATRLRLQIRDRYLRRPTPAILPWCVGVD